MPGRGEERGIPSVVGQGTRMRELDSHFSGHRMRVSIWMILIGMAAAVLPQPLAAQEPSLAAIHDMAERGSRAQALRQLDAFLETRPNHFEAQLLKGNLLVAVGRPAPAEQIFTSLVERYPDRPEPYNNLAVLQAQTGRYEEAAESLLGALGTHPSYRVAYQNLGKIYGQFASQAYSKALGVQASPGSQGVRLTLLSNPIQEAPDPASAPPASPPPAASPQASAETSILPPAEVAEAAEPARAQARPAEPEALSPEDEVASTVRAWARAWSEQRVEDYLAFYSSGFRPSSGVARARWAAHRRARLRAPRFIRVVLRSLQISSAGPDRVEAVFLQSYTSDRFSDTVRKRLLLARESGRWRIAEEVSAP